MKKSLVVVFSMLCAMQVGAQGTVPLSQPVASVAKIDPLAGTFDNYRYSIYQAFRGCSKFVEESLTKSEAANARKKGSGKYDGSEQIECSRYHKFAIEDMYLKLSANLTDETQKDVLKKHFTLALYTVDQLALAKGEKLSDYKRRVFMNYLKIAEMQDVMGLN